MNGPGYIVAFFTIEQVVFLMLLTDKEVAKKILCLSCSKNATMHIIEHDHIILLFINVDPDRIVRIENEQTESSMNLNEEIGVGGRSNSTTLSTDPLTGRHSFLHHVMRKSKKEKKHHPSARRREVLLSKISIYIVYMMVCCHRYVEIQ